MSGKYSKKKNSNKNKTVNHRNKKRNTGKLILLVILALLLAFAVFIAVNADEIFGDVFGRHSDNMGPNAAESSETVFTPTEGVQIEADADYSVTMENGLRVSDIGRYTGMFMEDGSDEIVTGVLMILVTNTSEKDLQYAEISIELGDVDALFTLSNIPSGGSAVVLEKNRMLYDASVDYRMVSSDNVAWFSEPMSLCDDRIQIQSMDGILNIINVSGEDITGEIVIYYKNSSQDMLYGGITYRIRISDGLKSGEIRQIVAKRFQENASTIMMVTIGG